MNLHDAKSTLLGDTSIRKSLEKKDLEDLKIGIGLQILELRLIKNLTQEQLARKIGTKQPSIARVERGALLPSLTFLHKIAEALKTDLLPPKFALVEQKEMDYQVRNFFTWSDLGTKKDHTLPTEVKYIREKEVMNSFEEINASTAFVTQ